MTRAPEGETLSQVWDSLRLDTLTVNRVWLAAVTERDFETAVPLPAVALNDNAVGFSVRPPPPPPSSTSRAVPPGAALWANATEVHTRLELRAAKKSINRACFMLELYTHMRISSI